LACSVLLPLLRAAAAPAKGAIIDLERWRGDFFRHLQAHLKPEFAEENGDRLAFKEYRVQVEQTNPDAITIIVVDAGNGDEVYVLDEKADADAFRLAWMTAIWLKAKP
jgi:hypothetical protein